MCVSSGTGVVDILFKNKIHRIMFKKSIFD